MVNFNLFQCESLLCPIAVLTLSSHAIVAIGICLYVISSRFSDTNKASATFLLVHRLLPQGKGVPSEYGSLLTAMGNFVLLRIALVNLLLVQGEYEALTVFLILSLARPWHLRKASEHPLGP